MEARGDAGNPRDLRPPDSRNRPGPERGKRLDEITRAGPSLCCCHFLTPKKAPTAYETAGAQGNEKIQRLLVVFVLRLGFRRASALPLRRGIIAGARLPLDGVSPLSGSLVPFAGRGILATLLGALSTLLRPLTPLAAASLTRLTAPILLFAASPFLFVATLVVCHVSSQK